jgi:hypothetical protein
VDLYRLEVSEVFIWKRMEKCSPTAVRIIRLPSKLGEDVEVFVRNTPGEGWRGFTQYARRSATLQPCKSLDFLPFLILQLIVQQARYHSHQQDLGTEPSLR